MVFGRTINVSGVWVEVNKCREQYGKDFYHAHIVVAEQDYGKHMIHRGAYNVTDVVLLP